MSIKIMTAVWESSKASGSNLLLLLSLADHAGEDGACWPSVGRLAQRARLSVRQAQRGLQALANIGEIMIVGGGGRKKTNMFLLTLCLSQAEAEATLKRHGLLNDATKGDTHATILRLKDTQKGDTHDQKGDIAMSPEPFKHHDPSIEDGNGQKTPVAPPSPLEGVIPLDFPEPPPPAPPISKAERMASLEAAHDRAVASRQQALDGTATQPQPLFWGATLPGVKRYRASRADDPAFALAEYVCAELERRGVPFDWGHKHAGGQACYWLQEAESLVRLCHNDRGLIDQVLTEAFRGSLSIKSPASIQYLVSEIKRDRGNRGTVAPGVVEDTTVADDRLRGLLA